MITNDIKCKVSLIFFKSFSPFDESAVEQSQTNTVLFSEFIGMCKLMDPTVNVVLVTI